VTTYLDYVGISGVKAIAQRVELDLRSPLVVLYAPNGTGKTSIWRAIESVIGDFRGADLQCARDDALPLEIVADIRTLEGAYKAIRTGTNRLRLEPEIGRPILGTDALRLIAPEFSLEGMQTKGPAIQSRLQEHIKSTRCLPADSLSYLIDDSEDSSALRRQIFADLTGTSSLQVELTELDTYLAKLLSARRDSMALRTKRVSDLEAQSAASDHESGDFTKLVHEAVRLMNFGISEDPDSDTLVKLKSTYSTQHAELEVRRKQIEELKTLIAKSDPSTSVEKLTLELAVLHESAKSTDVEISNSSDLHQKKIAEASSLGAKLVRIDKLVKYLDENLESILQISGTDGATPLETIALRLSLSTQAEAINSAASIRTRLSDISAWNTLDGEEKEHSARVAGLINSIGKIGDLTSLTKQLKEIEEHIDRQAEGKARLDRLMLSLADSARQVLLINPSSRCPCCSHQWQSEQSLIAAIDAGTALQGTTDEDFKSLQERRRTLLGLISEVSPLQRELDQAFSVTQNISKRRAELASRFQADGLRPEEIAELKSKLLAYDQDIPLYELLAEIDRGFPEVNMGNSVASLPSEAQSLKRRLEENLIVLQADLEVQSHNEQTLRLKADQQRQSIGAINARISELREIDARIVDISSKLGIGENFADEFRDCESTFDAQDIKLKTVGSLLEQASSSLGSARARKLSEEIRADVHRIQERINRLDKEIESAEELRFFIRDSESKIGRQFFDLLGPAIGRLFNHMQVNRIFKQINLNTVEQSFSLSGSIDNAEMLPTEYFSQGQRQDLALAMFLARACTLGGSYFLDEPLLHLDDLNRTALLDCVRACVIGTRGNPFPVKLMITTANWSVARQFIQKFANVKPQQGVPALTVYSLTGTVNSGVKGEVIYPQRARTTLQ
jgi:exonuclease SbcC